MSLESHVTEGEEDAGEAKKSTQEVMAKSLPSLAKDINLQIQQAEQTPNRKKQINKKSIPRHIWSNFWNLKRKKKILKAGKRK